MSLKKVYRSAIRAGATKELALRVMDIIDREAQPGISTTQIYDRIRSFLRQEMPVAAIRFSLKSSLRKLGPTGFPFEKYVTAILAQKGYWVQTSQIVSGYCVNYEIDFLAKKGGTLYIG